MNIKGFSFHPLIFIIETSLSFLPIVRVKFAFSLTFSLCKSRGRRGLGREGRGRERERGFGREAGKGWFCRESGFFGEGVHIG